MSRPLPHNVEAEQSVLGSLLMDREAISRVAPLVTAKDFYGKPHALIYAAMASLYEQRRPIDYVTVSAELESNGVLGSIGGQGYLLNLAAGVPIAIHAEDYAGIVHRLSIKRRLIEQLPRIAEAAYDPDLDASEAVQVALGFIGDVAGQTQDGAHETTIRAVLSRRLDDLMQGEAAAGLATGLPDLDAITGGLHRGRLVVVGGVTRSGKSAICTTIAHHAAVRARARVALCSMEMSASEVIDRLWAIEAGVDVSHIATGRVTQEEFERLLTAATALVDADVHVNDTTHPTPADILAYARRLHDEKPLDLLIVDYLQLMAPPPRRGRAAGGAQESRSQEVSGMARELKIIARELHVPLLAVAQLNRNMAARADHRPVLQDFREGAIENDADLVLLLHRPGLYDPAADATVADLAVAKHRHGPQGLVNLYFDAAHARFGCLARAADGSYAGTGYTGHRYDGEGGKGGAAAR